MKGIDNAVLAIYSSFKYGLFDEMRKHKLEKCRFFDYQEYHNTGRFCFKAINVPLDGTICNIAITIDRFGYKYYDELVDIFKSHANWLFEISGYDCYTDTFDIFFKRPIYDGVEQVSYRISNDCCIIGNGYTISKNIADYIDNDIKCVFETCKDINFNKTVNKTFYGPLNVNSDFDLTSHLGGFSSLNGLTIKDIRNQYQLPTIIPVPVLSKPPIFNSPATICYWTDGTKTVVKCQEGDEYSPEAGLALCYMKKVLGNTSRDLNKELHKYIQEEKEE